MSKVHVGLFITLVLALRTQGLDIYWHGRWEDFTRIKDMIIPIPSSPSQSLHAEGLISVGPTRAEEEMILDFHKQGWKEPHAEEKWAWVDSDFKPYYDPAFHFKARDMSKPEEKPKPADFAPLPATSVTSFDLSLMTKTLLEGASDAKSYYGHKRQTVLGVNLDPDVDAMKAPAALLSFPHVARVITRHPKKDGHLVTGPELVHAVQGRFEDGAGELAEFSLVVDSGSWKSIGGVKQWVAVSPPQAELEFYYFGRLKPLGGPEKLKIVKAIKDVIEATGRKLSDKLIPKIKATLGKFNSGFYWSVEGNAKSKKDFQRIFSKDWEKFGNEERPDERRVAV